jgi:L-glyceraldehyde reductase
MTQLPKSKARAVGVSNHTIPHLEAIINGTGVVPAANQIERHPVLQSNDLIEYCQKKGIHVTAYSVRDYPGYSPFQPFENANLITSSGLR